MEEEQVTVVDMMNARENRVVIQRKMQELFATPLVSFTLNIPGAVKSSDRIYDTFLEGCKRIEETLEKEGYRYLAVKYRRKKTGFEYYQAIECNPLKLKKLMIEVEDKDELGRLFDIDVLDVNGKIISRTMLEKKERCCLLCEKNAHECSRNRTHSVDELIQRIEEIMAENFEREMVWKVQ